MLEYIYNTFKYLLTEQEDMKGIIKYYSLYNEQILDQSKGIAFYPAALIDITIEPNIEQFAQKLQRVMANVEVYSAIEAPLELNSTDVLTQYHLNILKLADIIYKNVEGMNGKVIPTFTINDKYFAHSIHRYSTELITFNKMIKVAKTTYKFMLLDLSAMSEYEICKILDININAEINKLK